MQAHLTALIYFGRHEKIVKRSLALKLIACERGSAKVADGIWQKYSNKL